MPGPIAQLLTDDHDRLDALLRLSLQRAGEVERGPFDAFRAGLLRHIALEEKILLPAARAARGGDPLPIGRRLRVDHGAITSLLVPTPTLQLVSELRSILEPHNQVEEETGGLYEACDALLAGEAVELIARLRAYPPVRVGHYYDGPLAHRTAASALAASARQFERSDVASKPDTP